MITIIICYNSVIKRLLLECRSQWHTMYSVDQRIIDKLGRTWKSLTLYHTIGTGSTPSRFNYVNIFLSAGRRNKLSEAVAIEWVDFWINQARSWKGQIKHKPFHHWLNYSRAHQKQCHQRVNQLQQYSKYSCLTHKLRTRTAQECQVRSAENQ